MLRRNPLYAFRFVCWILYGKAHLKREIARRAQVDVGLLPYDARVIEWLRSDPERPRILCSASDQALAEAVATHVGGFERVLASDGAPTPAATETAKPCASA